MSRRSTRRLASASQSSSVTDEDPGCSQTSTKSGKVSNGLSQKSGLSKDQLNNLTNDMVFHIMMTSGEKTPVRRDVLSKAVLKEYSKLFPDILEAAKKKIAEVYGLDLKELPSTRNQYILTNKYLIEGGQSHIKFQKSVYQVDGLLFVILTIIFMNGGHVDEGDLWQALAKLDLFEGHSHEIFDNVKKLITKDFVKEQYLQYKVVPNTQPPTCEFSWGMRSDAEIVKMDVLEFAAKVYGNLKPDQFQAQFKMAQEELDQNG